jgi:hypothetical protein
VGESGAGFSALDLQPTTIAARSVSGEFRAGVAAWVQVTAAPASGTTSYAIEEKPPRGWTVSNISHDGTFDVETGTIRWGVFIDGIPRAFTYSVIPPAAVFSIGLFTGQFSFDGQLVEINSVISDGAARILIANSVRDSGGVHLQISGPAGRTGIVEASTMRSRSPAIASIVCAFNNCFVEHRSAGRRQASANRGWNSCGRSRRPAKVWREFYGALVLESTLRKGDALEFSTSPHRARTFDFADP